MLPIEICEKCESGGEIIKNTLGFFYREGCKVFLCAQCKAPLKPPNNGTAKCTRCNNGAVTASLVCPIQKVREP